MTGWQDDRTTGIWQDERQREDPRWIYLKHVEARAVTITFQSYHLQTIPIWRVSPFKCAKKSTHSWLSRGRDVSTSTEWAKLSWATKLRPGRFLTAPPPGPPTGPPPDPPFSASLSVCWPGHSDRVSRGFSARFRQQLKGRSHEIMIKNQIYSWTCLITWQYGICINFKIYSQV